MNKLSFLGFFIIIGSLLFAQIYHGASISGLFDLPAFLIVFGGTLGAVLVQTSSKQLQHAFSLVPKIFKKPAYLLSNQSQKIQKWSSQSRKVGLLSLESLDNKELDPFSEKGLAMLVDGSDSLLLQEVLQQDIDLDSEHCERSAQLFE